MPSKSTTKKARQAARQGKAPTTQAGEFVHEEIEHVRQGKHGARNAKQAIAIGLSKARRAGVKVPAPKRGTTSASTRRKAEQDNAKGSSRSSARRPSAKRSRATSGALKREGQGAASHRALSTQAKRAAAARRRRGTTATGGGRGRRASSSRSQ